MSTKTKRPTAYLLNLPDEMMVAAKMTAQTRGQSLADYIRSAVRAKLIFDGVGVEAGAVLKLLEEANEPLTRSTNFGAVHSRASFLLLLEMHQASLVREGVPESLAHEKATLMADHALAEAMKTLEDPRTLHPYRWIESPASDADLPDWLTDDPNV